MTEFILSADLKERMLGKIPGVLQDGADVYFQYDRMTIDPTAGTAGFYYKGELMFVMKATPMAPGDVMTISGVEGRMQAHLIN